MGIARQSVVRAHEKAIGFAKRYCLPEVTLGTKFLCLAEDDC